MTGPALNPANVAILDVTGKFAQSMIPVELASQAAAATAAAAAAAASATAAAASAAQAQGGPNAAESAAAALAAQAAAQAAQAAAETAAAAATAAAVGGGVSQAQVDAAIASNVSTAGRTGLYADLLSKPTIPTQASDIGAVPTASKGVANGVGSLDVNRRQPVTETPKAVIPTIACPGGVTPLRNTVVAATDQRAWWQSNRAPDASDYATGKALPGDLWTIVPGI